MIRQSKLGYYFNVTKGYPFPQHNEALQAELETPSAWEMGYARGKMVSLDPSSGKFVPATDIASTATKGLYVVVDQNEMAVAAFNFQNNDFRFETSQIELGAYGDLDVGDEVEFSVDTDGNVLYLKKNTGIAVGTVVRKGTYEGNNIIEIQSI